MKSIVITCEHGGHDIPDEFREIFNDAPDLQTHLAYDIGALDLFHVLEEKYADFSASSSTSRLLVELNRSLHHPKLFSIFTRNLPLKTRQAILNEYYFPYRNSIIQEIKNLIKHHHQVIHIGIHSFTPMLGDQVRNCDIGLLYDPRRPEEKVFCKQWKSAMIANTPNIKIRFNYPYLGTADGLTTTLRQTFPAHYLGIELEVNQKYANDNKMEDGIKHMLLHSLAEVLN